VSDRAERQRQFMERWEAARPATSPAWAQKRRLATAMRRVIDLLVQSDAPEEELRQAAEGMERYSERLAGHPTLPRAARNSPAPPGPEEVTFMDQSPFCGLTNPLAPPIRLREDDAWALVGDAIYGAAYEGPPGCVHGGHVAAAFDEVLGFVQGMSGQPGFTGRLTIRFRSPTPLHEPLRFRGEIAKVEGRKIHAFGTLHAGERLCAEAEGLFITPDPAQYERMLAAREKRFGER